jgi:autotransporter-associated beta strand protein
MKTIGNIRRRTHYSILTVVACAALAATNAWADKYKAYNTIPLNQAASWVENAVPTGTEFGVWGSAVTGSLANSLGANLTWGGIKILNPSGPATLIPGNTLTLMGVGGYGMDLWNATQDLTVNCALVMPASQWWCVASGRTLTVNGAVAGPGGLSKGGLGLLVMNATNTYTGPTAVSNGTLRVNGSLAAASAVTVQSTATLGGIGRIGGPVTVQANGTLAPGVGGIGTLTVSNTLTLAGNTVMEINRTSTPNCDRVAGITTLTYGGTLTVNNLGAAPQPGDAFTLFIAKTYLNAFASMNLPVLGPSYVWDTSTLALDGTIRVLQLYSYNIAVPAGCCTLIANQLNHLGGNTLPNIMPSLPCDARFFKWDNTNQVWRTNSYSTVCGWADGTMTLNPGEGAFLCPCCSSNFFLTFTGTLPVPQLPVSMVPGYWYLLSRQVPGSGTYDNITGLAPVPNAVAVTYTCGVGYTAHVFDEFDLVWYPSDPTTAVGTAMWVRLPGSGPPFPEFPNFPCPTNCVTNYTITIQGCCTLIANQLNHPGGNTLPNIIPSMPCDARFFKWDNTNQVWRTNTYSTICGWADGTMTLNPGEGAFLCPCCTSNFSLTFTGTAPTPQLPVSMVPGNWYLLSRQVPGPGTYDNITGSAPVPDVEAVTYTPCLGYTAHIFDPLDLVWHPSDPTTEVGTAMWVHLPGGGGTIPPQSPNFPCPTNCCLPPPSGITAWWPFDEATGTVANDIAFFNNQGAYMGGPTPAAGMVSNALCFDGINDFVLVADHPEINFAGSCTGGANVESFTIDAWIRANANVSYTEVLLDKRVNPNTTPQGYHLYLYQGHLGFQLGDGTSYFNHNSATPDLRDGQWHFIAVTVQRCSANGDIVTLYVDGAPVYSGPDYVTGDFNNSANLLIGRHASGGGFFSGCLDELEFFKRVLTAQEVQAIFRVGSAGKCKDTCLQAPILNCATNKTITCGVNWSFDRPTVSDVCCGTNVTVWLATTSSTVLDICHTLWQGIWKATNCLGYSATCTQLVTVVSPTPLSITCLPRTVTTLETACAGVMPDLRVPPLLQKPGTTNLDPTVFVNMATKALPPIGYDLDHNETNAFPVAYISFEDVHALFTNNTTGWKYVLKKFKHEAKTPVTYSTNGDNITETFASTLTGQADITLPGGTSPAYTDVYIQADGLSTVVVSNYHGTCGDFQTAMTSMSLDGTASIPGGSLPFHIGVSATNVSSGRTIVTNCVAGDPTIISGFNIYPVLTVGTDQPIEAQAPVWVQAQPVTGGVQIQGCNPIQSVTQDPPPGTLLTPGYHAVTIEVVDICGHTNHCGTWVHVTAPPVLTCAANKTVQCGAPWSFDPPSVFDVCCGPDVTLSLIRSNCTVLDNCHTLCQGVWYALNCLGYSATCTQWVTVVSPSPPSITCLPRTLTAEGTNCFAFLPDLRVPPVLGTPGNTNLDPTVYVNMATKVLPPMGYDLDHERSNAFPVAYISFEDVHALFTNVDGSKYVLSNVQHTVTQPATFTTNGPNIIETFESQLTALAAITPPGGPTFTDVYIQATGRVTVVVSNYNGGCGDFQTAMTDMSMDGVAGVGTMTKSFHIAVSTVNTSSGRTIVTNCTPGDPTIISGFNVYPVLTVDGGTPMEAQAPVWVQVQPVTGGIQIQSCNPIASVTQDPPPGIILGIGWHPVTITAVDVCGKSSQCFTYVHILETVPPVVTCASNKTILCGATWDFDKPSAWDVCCGTNVTSWLGGKISTSVDACHTLWQGLWNVSDCYGNVATCTQLVTVVTPSPPSITCLPRTLTAEGTNCFVYLPDLRVPPHLGTPGTTNLDPAVYVNMATKVLPPMGYDLDHERSNSFPVAYISFDDVHALFTNVDGSKYVLSNVQHTVTQPATFTTNGANITETFESQLTALAAITPPGGPTFFDVYIQATGRVTVVVSNYNGGCGDFRTAMTDMSMDGVAAIATTTKPFHIAVSTVNQSSGRTIVTNCTPGDPTIISGFKIYPVLTVDGGVPMEAQAPVWVQVRPVTGGIQIQSCSPIVSVTQNPPPGTLLPIGWTIVTITAVDVCGNSSECLSWVQVQETVPPVINCVSNKTILCGAPWSFDKPGAWDICCGNNVTVWLASSNCTVLDTCHTLCRGIWNAMDCHGNLATCTQLVTVVIPSSPSITCLPRDLVLGVPGPNCTATLPDLRAPPLLGVHLEGSNFNRNVFVNMATKVLPPLGYDLDHERTNSFPVAYISYDDVHALFTNASKWKYVLRDFKHTVTQPATFTTNGANITETFASELTGFADITVPPDATPTFRDVYIKAVGLCTVVVSNYHGECGDFQTAMTSMSLDGTASVGMTLVPFHLAVSSTNTSSGRTIVTNCVAGDPTIISGFNIYPVLTVGSDPPMEAEGPVWVQVTSVTNGIEIKSCSPIATVTQDPPPGTPLGVGVHWVTILAIDVCGHSAQCSTRVTVTVQPLRLTISHVGDMVVLTWTGGGILQEAAVITGPWTDLPLATSPYVISSPKGTKFYRLRGCN